MPDSFNTISYKLTSSNGMIYLWILCGVAVVVALIILFDPFRRRHKEYKYPWSKGRSPWRFNPFGFVFRPIRRFYRNLSNEMERRRRERSESRE